MLDIVKFFIIFAAFLQIGKKWRKNTLIGNIFPFNVFIVWLQFVYKYLFHTEIFAPLDVKFLHFWQYYTKGYFSKISFVQHAFTHPQPVENSVDTVENLDFQGFFEPKNFLACGKLF